MKFKALRMALAAVLLMTSSLVVAVTAVEHSLLNRTTVSLEPRMEKADTSR